MSAEEYRMHPGTSRSLAMATGVGLGLLIIACNRLFGVVPPPPEPRSPYLVDCQGSLDAEATDAGLVRPVEFIRDPGAPDRRGPTFELLTFRNEDRGEGSPRHLLSYGEAHRLWWGELVTQAASTSVRAISGPVTSDDLGDPVFAIAPSPAAGGTAVWFAVHCDVRSECYLQRYQYGKHDVVERVEATLSAVESTGASTSGRYVLTSAAPPRDGAMLFRVMDIPERAGCGMTNGREAFQFCWSANEPFQADATHLRCECLEIVGAPASDLRTVTSRWITEVLPLEGPPVALLEGAAPERLVVLSATTASELKFGQDSGTGTLIAAKLGAVFPGDVIGVANTGKDALVFAMRDCVGVAELRFEGDGPPKEATCAFKRERPIVAIGFLDPNVYWVESRSALESARSDGGEPWQSPELFRAPLDKIKEFGSDMPHVDSRLCATSIMPLGASPSGVVPFANFRFASFSAPDQKERRLFLSGHGILWEVAN